jgi:hypothetical protein
MRIPLSILGGHHVDDEEKFRKLDRDNFKLNATFVRPQPNKSVVMFVIAGYERWLNG